MIRSYLKKWIKNLIKDDFKFNIEKLHRDIILPNRANINDVGFDVYSPKNFMIASGEDKLISLGFKVEFSPKFAMVFENKSGRAIKNKLIIGACVIDPGYRGEIFLHLFNIGKSLVKINRNEKIAQFLIYKVSCINHNEVDKIDINTDRGEGKFGSTGL